VKIEIDDSLLSRHNELLMSLIQAGRDKDQIGNQVEHQRWREVESIERQIMKTITGAYVNRGNDENNT